MHNNQSLNDTVLDESKPTDDAALRVYAVVAPRGVLSDVTELDLRDAEHRRHGRLHDQPEHLLKLLGQRDGVQIFKSDKLDVVHGGRRMLILKEPVSEPDPANPQGDPRVISRGLAVMLNAALDDSGLAVSWSAELFAGCRSRPGDKTPIVNPGLAEGWPGGTARDAQPLQTASARLLPFGAEQIEMILLGEPGPDDSAAALIITVEPLNRP